MRGGSNASTHYEPRTDIGLPVHLPLKRGRLRLEGLWWMTRPGSLLTGFIAVPGWLAAGVPPSNWRLAAMVAAIFICRALSAIVNDILDEEKDRVTAPSLPLPAGLVTVSQAALAAGVLTIIMLALLRFAAGDWPTFAVGLIGLALGGLFFGSYSFVKPFAILAMAVTSVAYMTAPLTAWLVAGGSWSIAVGIVLVYGLLKGLAANVFSTLRDVDRDAAVGNYSIAVRLGPTRALRLAVLIEAASILCILLVAAALETLLLGTIVTIASLGYLLGSYVITERRQRTVSTRNERAALIWPLNSARNYAAIALVQSPPVGIVVGLITLATIKFIVPLQQRRILGGELRRELADHPSREWR